MTLTITADPAPMHVEGDGTVRIGETRVTLDTVIIAFRSGKTAEEIVAQYPSLKLADIYAVISYYLRHSAQVDEYLKARDDEARQIRQQMETHFNPKGIRERLLARKNLGEHS